MSDDRKIISADTAYRIWLCHREIEMGQKLLADVLKTISEDQGPTPVDRSHRCNFELGVPNNFNGHRLVNVEPELALRMIEAHMTTQRLRLLDLTIKVREELA